MSNTIYVCLSDCEHYVMSLKMISYYRHTLKKLFVGCNHSLYGLNNVIHSLKVKVIVNQYTCITVSHDLLDLFIDLTFKSFTHICSSFSESQNEINENQ